MEFPIFDEVNFLSEDQFQEIEKLLPVSDWSFSNIHHKASQKDVLDPNARSCIKVKEFRKGAKRTMEKIITKRLLPLFRKDPRFRYLAFRFHHTEWLRYYKGTYFKPHTDFERFICNDMVPYVCLLGMNDTLEGGETKVASLELKGGTLRNGMACFPGNLVHEAKPVLNGIKLLLKLEFFVFFADENSLMVSDSEHKWRSYWNRKDLPLIDNFLQSSLDFSSQCPSNHLVVSEESAKQIYKCMLYIADPSSLPPHERNTFDMFFPSVTPHYVHDVMVVSHFFRNNKSNDLILGNCPDVWQKLNQGDFDVCSKPFLLGAVLYVRNHIPNPQLHKDFEYVLSVYRNGQSESPKDPHVYSSYQDIQDELILWFIQKNEIQVKPQKDQIFLQREEKLKNGISIDSSPSLPEQELRTKMVEPLLKKQINGTKTIEEIEFCDEELGYELYTMDIYVRKDIEIRWFVKLL